ncbi:MAG: 4Fe-4S dicluster domain-containing protein [Planctomycetaceae bacterium]
MSGLLNILNNGGSCGSGDSSSHACGSGGSCGSCHDDSSASRREFLAQASTMMLGGFSLSLLPMKPDGAGAGGSTEEVMYGFLVDTERCIGAGKCLTACRTENNVPEGYARTWVERFVHYKDGRVEVDLVPETGYEGSGVPEIDPETVDRAYFVPKLCNQCTDAPCNQVCPVHASFKSPEGVELVDPDTCIGCAYCVQACPYGVRFINPDTGNADKCTWCYHRIVKNEQPACVEACPVNARVFGRLDDPNSEIRQRLAKVPTSVLKEYLGTHPRLHYIGLPQEVT